MSLRAYREADHAALLDFLQGHEATSMFAIGNLLGRGMKTRVWLAEQAGKVTGYLGLSHSGNILVQYPQGDWASARALLAGQRLHGVLGPPDQCQALLTALDLSQSDMAKSSVEPGFSLDLSQLILPPSPNLRALPITAADSDLILQWRCAYIREVLRISPEDAALEAQADLARMLETNSHRLLWRGQTPVAMAGFNIDLGEVAQVGGVYTPPALRGQGFARAVVALLLAEARENGLKRALLFAASDQAARVYLAIGFQPSHAYAIHFFAEPQEIACP